jgi:hypothetical protein
MPCLPDALGSGSGTDRFLGPYDWRALVLLLRLCGELAAKFDAGWQALAVS